MKIGFEKRWKHKFARTKPSTDCKHCYESTTLVSETINKQVVSAVFLSRCVEILVKIKKLGRRSNDGKSVVSLAFPRWMHSFCAIGDGQILDCD